MFFKRIKSAFSDYFTFTTRERRGSVWLLLIVSAQLMWLFYYKHIRAPEAVDLSDFNVEILKPATTKPPDNHNVNLNDTSHQDSLFAFDPNTVGVDAMKLLGLSEKQALTVINYRSKGGVFRKKDDFSKMYSVTPALYSKLEPFITIQASAPYTSKPLKFPRHEKSVPEIVELNDASVQDLDKLPFIGLSRAERIIKYREALGGFISVEQLREVYGVDSIAYDAISARVKVDPGRIRKTNVNNDSLRHPYLPYKSVKVIRAYRRQHGNFERYEDIREVSLLNEEIYVKIAPYLTAE
jgi:competence protein ComEA